MRFSSWLRSRASNGAPRGRASHRPAAVRHRPRFEALDDRIVPAQVGLTVGSLADSGPGTLRAAILAADAGKPSDKFTVDFAVAGTIDLLSPLPDLNNTIAVQGPGAGSLTIQRDSAITFSAAIVTVGPGQAAGLSGVTIADGDAGGIANHGGTLTVSGCTISGNFAQNGGGIFNAGTATIDDSALTGNTASFDGGGISNLGTMTVSYSTLSGNRSLHDVGGAIINAGGDTVSLTHCTVAANFATDGGGIFNDGGSVTIQQGCTLSGNAAAFGGGVDNFGALAVRDSTLSGNTATGFTIGGRHFAGFGGGIENFGAAGIQGSTLSGNTAELGGALANTITGTMTVSRSTVAGNTASSVGGGVFNDGGATLTVSACTLSGNTAGSSGGGIDNGGAATISQSTLSDNSAVNGGGIRNDVGGSTTVYGGTFRDNSATDGGAIANDDALTVHGSTFTGNSATDSGGGLDDLGTATLDECSLSGNTAGARGGGIFNGTSATLAIDDSVVVGNAAPIGADLDDLGSATAHDSTIGVIGH
jgi:hypothetical protein